MKNDNVMSWIACAVIIATVCGAYALSINIKVFAQDNTTGTVTENNSLDTNTTSYDFGQNDSALGSGNISGLLFGSG